MQKLPREFYDRDTIAVAHDLLGKLLVKRLQLTGSTLRTRTADFKAGLLARMEERLWPLFESGQLKPLVAKTYSFDQAEEAFAELARDQIVGKIVLLK